MSASCALCGMLYPDKGELTVRGVCPGPAAAQLDCRDRELANLRSLLRSVTGKLEEAQGNLETMGPEPGSTIFAAYRLIDSVLEALS